MIHRRSALQYANRDEILSHWPSLGEKLRRSGVLDVNRSYPCLTLPARDSRVAPYLHTPVYQSRNQCCRYISHRRGGSLMEIDVEGVLEFRAAEHHRSAEPRLTLVRELGNNLLTRLKQRFREGNLARHAQLDRGVNLRFKGPDK